MPSKSDIPVRLPAGNVLFPALLMKEGLKPSSATTLTKASERVIADTLALERQCSALLYESGFKPYLATTAAKAS